MSKRKRDPTFTASEKFTLIELVERHFNIVESKKTDIVNMKAKNEEWKKIADEFNATSSIHSRDWIVLKNCWENLKKRAKQCQTQRNQHFLGTGGGPPKKNIEDPAIEKVLELIQTRVTGFTNQYDSDGTLVLASGNNTQNPLGEGTSGTASKSTEPLQNIEHPNDEDSRECEDVVELEINWSHYTPNMLRRAKTPALARSSQLKMVADPQLPEGEGQLPKVNEQLALANPQLPVAESQMPEDDPQLPEADPHLSVMETSHSRVTPARVSTTQVAAEAARAKNTSRRRPVSTSERNAQSLTSERINTLLKCNVHAEEEHKMNMSILKIKEAREREILEREKIITQQEKIKLEILELELRKLKE